MSARHHKCKLLHVAVPYAGLSLSGGPRSASAIARRLKTRSASAIARRLKTRSASAIARRLKTRSASAIARRLKKGPPLPRLQVLDHLAARIRTRCARDSSTGMCPGTTKIQTADGRSILCPTDNRPKGKKLIQRMFPVKDVATGHTVDPLQIDRRQDLASNDGVANFRRIIGKRLHNSVRQLITPSAPVSVFQPIRGVLDVNRHDVCPFGRKRLVRE